MLHHVAELALIDGMTADQFQLTFRAKFLNRYARPMIRFAYQGDDNFFQVGIQGDAKFIFVQHVTDDSAASQTPDSTDTNAIPGIGTGTNVWFRYESDGSTITGYCIASFAQPTETDWSNTNPFVTYTGLPNNGRGGIGLGTRSEGGIEFDNVTLRSDPDGDAEERAWLLTIGAELKHQVKGRIGVVQFRTYQRWLKEHESGVKPGPRGVG